MSNNDVQENLKGLECTYNVQAQLYIRCLLLKYRLIFFTSLESIKGSSNTERRVKISAGISKEGT